MYVEQRKATLDHIKTRDTTSARIFGQNFRSRCFMLLGLHDKTYSELNHVRPHDSSRPNGLVAIIRSNRFCLKSIYKM